MACFDKRPSRAVPGSVPGSVPGAAFPAAVGLALLFAAAPPGRAAGYVAAGTSTLVVSEDAAAWQQGWTAACVVDAPDDAATLTIVRELRFAADPVQVLASGDGAQALPLVEGGAGAFRWTAVDGVYVLARLVVRCGTDAVYDEVVVDSAPLIVAPAVEPPWAVTRTDALGSIDGTTVPAGVEIELTGLGVRAAPRGADVVTVRAVGAGVDAAFEFVAGDFVDGRLVVSPRLRPTMAGTIRVDAALRGAASTPLDFVVVDDTLLPGGGEPRSPVSGSDGCAATTAGVPVLPAATLVGAVAFGWRRRRGRR
ncbi:MAG: hypothetical protein FJ137_13740 [Deltaproteobacteria bacterium]|nr:hypothetical protein [Deltaproteobacteria bacterium]